MTRLESPRRPRTFTALIAAGSGLLVLLAFLGRSWGTHALAVLYLSGFFTTVVVAAAGSDDRSSGKT